MRALGVRGIAPGRDYCATQQRSKHSGTRHGWLGVPLKIGSRLRRAQITCFGSICLRILYKRAKARSSDGGDSEGFDPSANETAH